MNPHIDYSKVKAICIGRQTAEEAERYGMEVTISAQATIDSMIETMLGLEP